MFEFEYLIHDVFYDHQKDNLILEAFQYSERDKKSVLNELKNTIFFERKILDRFGKQGWECFETNEEVTPENTKYTAKFKRRIDNSFDKKY